MDDTLHGFADVSGVMNTAALTPPFDRTDEDPGLLPVRCSIEPRPDRSPGTNVPTVSRWLDRFPPMRESNW